MSTLLSVIERVRKDQTDAWLYIADDAKDLTLNSEAELGSPEYDENTDEEIHPAGFENRGLQVTIDVGTVKQCIDWADRISRTKSNDAALVVIRYYILFDAFPETLNPSNPPSPEESLRRYNLEFCNRLGPEDPKTKCRREGCERGVVKLSAFCRRHHFENVRNSPYPLED